MNKIPTDLLKHHRMIEKAPVFQPASPSPEKCSPGKELKTWQINAQLSPTIASAKCLFRVRILRLLSLN